MATADHVKALIKSHAEGDDERFYAIAMQVAAQAARQGHATFAQELRDLVDQARARARAPSRELETRPVPILQPRGELAGLLTATYPKTRLAEMALDEGVSARIQRVLVEQRSRGRINEHGFSPLRKLLFVGAPGTGKTMTAAALAGELGLALFTIQLDGLITKYLGETAAKLRLIFDAIRDTRAVYLFDEFDALGAERAAKNEVGEIRRVLNSFLQFLELDDSQSLIVAATNYPKLLDRALFRRFEAVVEYPLPSRHVAERVLRARLALLDTSLVHWDQVLQASDGLSHADLSRACEQAAKNAILAHRRTIETVELVEALEERRAAHGH
jgi:SpoVK/Ycf46/Vps4 family AAA+-type ATPase